MAGRVELRRWRDLACVVVAVRRRCGARPGVFPLTYTPPMIALLIAFNVFNAQATTVELGWITISSSVSVAHPKLIAHDVFVSDDRSDVEREAMPSRVAACVAMGFRNSERLPWKQHMIDVLSCSYRQGRSSKLSGRWCDFFHARIRIVEFMILMASALYESRGSADVSDNKLVANLRFPLVQHPGSCRVKIRSVCALHDFQRLAGLFHLPDHDPVLMVRCLPLAFAYFGLHIRVPRNNPREDQRKYRLCDLKKPARRPFVDILGIGISAICIGLFCVGAGIALVGSAWQGLLLLSCSVVGWWCFVRCVSRHL